MSALLMGGPPEQQSLVVVDDAYGILCVSPNQFLAYAQLRQVPRSSDRVQEFFKPVNPLQGTIHVVSIFRLETKNALGKLDG